MASLDETSRPPIRLLLVAEGETIPSWLAHCIDALRRSGAVAVTGIVRGKAPAQRTGFLYRLHALVDRRLFRPLPDALAPISLRDALPHCPVMREAEVARGMDPPADVVLDPFALLADPTALRARRGVWTVAFGRSGDAKTQSAPAYWEVAEGIPATETRLCIRQNGGSPDRTPAAYVSVAPTDRRSVSRTQNHVYWKLATALTSKLRQLWENAEAFTGGLDGAATFAVVPRPSATPSNLSVVRGCASLVGRYIAEKWRDARYREQWALAYRLGAPGPGGDREFVRLLPPIDRFWADPFPVRVGTQYYVFHEELLFSNGKGYLVVTVLDERGTVLDQCIPVLEQDHHLSYPFVFQWEGEFFMIPETASRECIQLYRCVRFPDQWRLERVLLSGVRAYDSTPAFLFGRWWLFANVAAHGAGTMDELQIFHADSPLGPWIPHARNPVKSDVRSARPAGRIFERDGQIYRPAQDCSKHYGYAVSINRIARLDPEAYEEVEVDKIVPAWGPEVAGVHTFNAVGDLTVIDCLIRRRLPWPGLPASLRSYNM